MIALLKTFLVGIVLGVAAAAGLLYAYPVVDQFREASIISVAANGGNRESFHVNIPMDRIVIGARGRREPLPPGLEWPTDPVLTGVRTEIFKIRNARDAVVGIAARTAARSESGDVIDWVLHLPARGSLFVNLGAEPREGGFRIGDLRAGSREFGPLKGVLTERWIADTSGREDAPTGRIELTATYIGELEPLE